MSFLEIRKAMITLNLFITGNPPGAPKKFLKGGKWFKKNIFFVVEKAISTNANSNVGYWRTFC